MSKKEKSKLLYNLCNGLIRIALFGVASLMMLGLVLMYQHYNVDPGSFFKFFSRNL